jgi:hypothetical protein
VSGAAESWLPLSALSVTTLAASLSDLAPTELFEFASQLIGGRIPPPTLLRALIGSTRLAVLSGILPAPVMKTYTKTTPRENPFNIGLFLIVTVTMGNLTTTQHGS